MHSPLNVKLVKLV